MANPVSEPTMTSLILELGVIYGGSALLATIFLFLKQPVVLAYIFAGILLGPSGLEFIKDPDAIERFAHFGIILLMFLIGIDLDIKDLLRSLKKTALLTIGSSILFAGTTVLVLTTFGIPLSEAIIAGAGLMFSSTVVGLKLLPTTDLHQKRIGELMVSILLFQDILAILVILILSGHGNSDNTIIQMVPMLVLKAVALFAVCFYTVKYLVFNLFRRFDVIQEYIFVFSIGWCLLLAEVGHGIGLSHEIGAFIAGISLAVSPVAMIIAEKLKPLREFFLILFFFAIGAEFNLSILPTILLPGLVLAILLVVIKPLAFSWGFRRAGENSDTARELGTRLGQGSEFSLLVVVSALADNLISERTLNMVQFTVIATFMISTYMVMRRYATPISVDAKHRRD